MTLQLHNVGNGGRFGNHLFTIAALIGQALKQGKHPLINEGWKYRRFFPNIPAEWYGKTERNDVPGWCQNPALWEGYEEQIRHYLNPVGEDAGQTQKIAIHFRRGDYLNNPNYYQIPLTYYLGALNYMPDLPMWGYSDDKEFLKLHGFEPGGNEMEDFLEACRCKYHIIANSTFSWWAAYIANGKTIMPSKWYDGNLAKSEDSKPLEIYQICLFAGLYDCNDLTIIIPYSHDHTQREENLFAVYRYVNTHFNSHLLIGEINTNNLPLTILQKKNFDYNGIFHRTKALNELTKLAETKYVLNLDCDVLMSPFNIIRMLHELRKGADIVYPYDGRFYWGDRGIIDWLKKRNDLNYYLRTRFQAVGASATDKNSYGGAVGYNKEAFLKAGGENEMHVSYSNEDQERWWRFNLLGLNVKRVAGAIYHINHWRGKDSSEKHENGRNNMQIWNIEKNMTKQEVEAMVNHPKWNNGMSIEDLKNIMTNG